MKSFAIPTVSILLFYAPFAEARDRPAPPASRYEYELKIDEASLPEGVVIRELNDIHGARTFIRNTSPKPLVINQRFQGDRLVSGTKLESGKVYNYFPNGVPMAGKQHLKGWQAPFGEINETIIRLPNDPQKIYDGRKPGLGKEIPPNEATTIEATWDGKPYEIKATIIYKLNDKYGG